MRLSRRLLFALAPPITATLACAFIASIGLHAQSQLTQKAHQSSLQLSRLTTATQYVTQARTILLANPSAHRQATVLIERAHDSVATLEKPLEETQLIVSGLSRSIDTELDTLQNEDRAREMGVRLSDPMLRLSDLSQQALEEISSLSKQAKTLQSVLQWVGVALFAFALGSAFWLGRTVHHKMTDPLRRINQMLDKLAQGDLEQRIPEEGDQELQEVAVRINRMAKALNILTTDLETQVNLQARDLAQHERLAAVGHLASGVAHEINNPLGIIVAEAELALRERDSTLHEPLEIIRDEAFRCKEITRRLLCTARATPQRIPVDLSALATDCLKQIPLLHPSVNIKQQIDIDNPSSNWTSADPNEIRQVVLNLITNAIDATRLCPDPYIHLALKSGDATLTLCVTDNGTGMSSTHLTSIFDPFFTTKCGTSAQIGGTGLGLSIAQSIVSAHGGQLSASSSGLGKGSTFSIQLPRIDAPTDVPHYTERSL